VTGFDERAVNDLPTAVCPVRPGHGASARNPVVRGGITLVDAPLPHYSLPDLDYINDEAAVKTGVLERAARLGEVGTGLGVLLNAVRALTAMGVSRRLHRNAGPFRRFRICNQRGEEIEQSEGGVSVHVAGEAVPISGDPSYGRTASW
jgi:hypothetical protein